MLIPEIPGKAVSSSCRKRQRELSQPREKREMGWSLRPEPNNSHNGRPPTKIGLCWPQL
jgi:hypothetical protein